MPIVLGPVTQTHIHRIVTLKDCHEFIRKATLHASKVTQHYEAKVLLLLNVLVNYSLRATYVLQLDIDI